MKKYFLLITVIIAVGCLNKTRTNVPSIIELADTYFAQYIKTFPENAVYLDVPIENHSGFSSNNLIDVKKWEEFEESIFNQLSNINEAKIETQNDKITYWSLKELLESNISMRICKQNLWNVNPLWGWQIIWNYVADEQPVDSEQHRLQAIERWNKFPAYVDTEIDNLKKGLSNGYSMPKEIVTLVIEQIQVFLDYKIDDSPFMSPAKRSENEQFYSEWKALVAEKINPSIFKYQQFLINEYFDSARDEVSILSLPNGDKCYQAHIRLQTSTQKTGEEIFRLGQQIVLENRQKVMKLGSDLYQTNDFEKIIAEIDNDSSNYFKTSEEILAFHNKLVSKTKEECKNWFNKLPSADVVIKPYAAHEYGTGAYEAANGANPPYFRINLKNPEQQQKGDNERLAIHEVYPGHHMQRGIEKEIEGLHPIMKLVSFNSYTEGWARYAEQLAEEMGLYSTKTALINRRAWPARGMVVDPGVHLYSWTKEQAINYMMESGMNKSRAENLYYRIIIKPALLASYDVGGEEIKELRSIANKELGENFDIKEFNSKILENGTIPLEVLKKIIYDWIDKNK